LSQKFINSLTPMDNNYNFKKLFHKMSKIYYIYQIIINFLLINIINLKMYFFLICY